MMEAANFTWDNGGGSAIFSGYHDPRITWNGWACPFFERDQVESIIAYDRSLPDNDSSWRWEGKVLFWTQGGEEDAFTPEFITVDGQQKEVWAIGAFFWTWSTIK